MKQLNEYPTPETKAAHEGRSERYLGGTVDYKIAAGLERRLAMCRDGLRAAMNLLESLGGEDGLSETGVEQYRNAKEALRLTQPK